MRSQTTLVLTFLSLASPASGAFVGFFQSITQVSTGGVLLDQCRIVARFDATSGCMLHAFNLSYVGGATVPDPHCTFWHKDNSDYNGGVLSKSLGSWRPTATGSATANRPFDSYLTLGGDASAIDSTAFDPSFPPGASWNPDHPCLANGIGWFNASPPNGQGCLGGWVPGTDILIGQFVIDRGAFAGNWQLTVAFNDGIPGSAVQFATATFGIGIPTPGALVLLGLGALARRRSR